MSLKKITIYQIDKDIDYDEVCFSPYDNLENLQGTKDIDSSIYMNVFSGTVESGGLEDIYRVFNTNSPDGYKGRSLSVSDVVAIENENMETKYFYCDKCGFVEVEFDPNEAKEAYITVVLCEPGKLAKVVEIKNELENLQSAVEGEYIEAYYPFVEQVCIVCDDCGKINGQDLCRAVKREGEVIEVIAGPFFICDCSTPNFKSLSKDQQDRYLKQFKYPEFFFRDSHGIIAVPYNPEHKDRGER